MAEYIYARGLNWRQNPSGEWEWESSGGQWNAQELAPRVSTDVTELDWRTNPSGEREWQSDDGTWHPEEWAPELAGVGADAETSSEPNRTGPRTTAIFFVLLGLLAIAVGLFVWIAGNGSHSVCEQVNNLVAGAAPPNNCSNHTETHIGMIIFFAGLAALLVSGLVYMADRLSD